MFKENIINDTCCNTIEMQERQIHSRKSKCRCSVMTRKQCPFTTHVNTQIQGLNIGFDEAILMDGVMYLLHIWLGSKKSALIKHIGRFWKFFNIWWQREISYQSNLCNFPQILIELNCEGLRKLQMRISKSRESTVEIFKHWMLAFLLWFVCMKLIIQSIYWPHAARQGSG